jgi:hypothetical protein
MAGHAPQTSRLTPAGHGSKPLDLQNLDLHLWHLKLYLKIYRLNGCFFVRAY